MTARYEVAEGTQVHHAGRTYGAGEVLEAPPDQAVEWLARGWVTVVPPRAKRAT